MRPTNLIQIQNQCIFLVVRTCQKYQQLKSPKYSDMQLKIIPGTCRERNNSLKLSEKVLVLYDVNALLLGLMSAVV
jgi:hypothetical protein